MKDEADTAQGSLFAMGVLAPPHDADAYLLVTVRIRCGVCQKPGLLTNFCIFTARQMRLRGWREVAPALWQMPDSEPCSRQCETVRSRAVGPENIFPG